MQFGTQNNGAFYGAPTAGFQYTGATQVEKHHNVLTPEQIKRLQQNSAEFSLAITEDEMLRGICNHRTPDGESDSLVYDQETGLATCTICGYTFKPIDRNISIDEIREATTNIVDILQTIKLLFLDLPANAAQEYFQIIPLIEKIPKFFELAAKSMTRHEANNWQYNGRNMGAVNMFQNLQNVFATMNQPMQPNGMPMGGPGYGYAGTATPNPFTGAPQMNPGANPAFGMGANPGMAGYNPQQAQQGFQFTPDPQQATQPVQPTVAQPAEAGKDTKTVTQTLEV